MTTVDSASANADAHGADVVSLSREEYEALKAQAAGPVLYDHEGQARKAVKAAQAFVDKQRAHLAAAEQSLAEAEAHLTETLDRPTTTTEA